LNFTNLLTSYYRSIYWNLLPYVDSIEDAISFFTQFTTGGIVQ